MPDRQVRVFVSIEDLNRAAADHFAAAVTEAIRLRRSAHAALSGGTTPQGLFRLLAQPPYRAVIPWELVHFYWADERCVPPDDPESNYGQAKLLLLDHIPVRQANIHRIAGEMAPDQAAAQYTRLLAQHAETGQTFPRLDWVLLGHGADGHTASLFPGQVHPGEDRLPVLAVTAQYEGRPADRVTLTPLVFNAARNIVFLATGEGKAAALAAALYGPRDPLNHPAQRIQPTDGMVTWMVDIPAASGLPKDPGG